jgi:hypothetical protein
VYSRQNNNRPFSFAKLIGTGVVFLIVVLAMKSSNKSSQSGSPITARDLSSPQVSGVNPIYKLVAQNPTPTADGVAIAVLIDTSGSMDDPVPDGPGKTSPKITIAKRCSLNFLRQCETFTKAHSDKKVLLAIYEFSYLGEGLPMIRTVLALGIPDSRDAAGRQFMAMRANGGTPIGDAMIHAYQDLAASRLTRKHILVVTDGENNQGYQPGDVTEALGRLGVEQRPSIYFIAFDVNAEHFKPVADAGGLVMSAGDAPALQTSLDYLLSGKILVEQPDAPPVKVKR